MATPRMRIDPATRERLGPGALAELAVNLRAVDCQTCGQPLGRWGKPALEVRSEDDFAAAALHHPRCRQPGWVEDGLQVTELQASGRPHVTWRAGCFRLPPGELPLFLVNPSYEYALLRNADGWRVANLEPFVRLGFEMVFPSSPLPPLPALSASIDGDRVSVDVQHGGAVLHAWRDVPIEHDVARVTHNWGSLMIGVTTLVDVSRPFLVERLMDLIAVGGVAIAQAPLVSISYAPGDQRLKPRKQSDQQVEAFSLAAEAMRRVFDLEVDDRQVAAGFALSDGKTMLIRHSAGRDRIAVLYMLSVYYALWSRDGDDEPQRACGVHLIAPDAASADELAGFFSAAAETGVLGSVGRLGASPLSGEGSAAYLSDAVIGTAEEFAAAFNAYRDAGGEWSLHASRGYIAIAIDASEADITRADFVRHYPKVVAF
ncbi:hypothetical protein [Actinomadura madurae]|uniref:hypothetical protein n=2 Tax=Actinomadura madurae TaxID=1993 RepID=UPI0020D21E27|nr:hypothetical protein [Actinomadura madurae]MCP9953147.1 hypothetical protein [Actinomadura madurae]MCP9969912.1 hypothetical protein [Actinomadura madurae]MCQ0006109.1 hypothetical protein [Actinomadura madurae]MCQ0018609.1 hypothetical protein [Actinomadura madurae]